MTAYVIPCLLAFVFIFALSHKTDPYTALIDGAKNGLHTTAQILPALVVLLTGIAMLRASGALDALTALLRPLTELSGIPPEVTPLMLLRPLSGSGGLAIGADLIRQYGPDSAVGRTAAVMLGSTETTFYTIAVYFGAAGIHKTRYTVPAALFADCIGFLAAAAAVRLFF